MIRVKGVNFAVGEIQIEWIHNGVVLKSTDHTREVLENNSLRITNVDANATGWYACLASNDIGTVTSRQALLRIACELSHVIDCCSYTCIRMCMLGLIAIGNNQPSRQMVTGLVGGSLKLDCGDYGSLPVSTVTWSKTDCEIINTRLSLGENVITSIVSGSLYFRRLTASHSGCYHCTVTNTLTYSNLIGSYTLYVNGKSV